VTRLGFDLNFLWGLYVAQRLLQGAFFTWLWAQGKWKDVNLE
jgi:MATE family multidrug resistance protein